MDRLRDIRQGLRPAKAEKEHMGAEIAGIIIVIFFCLLAWWYINNDG
ncbi:hypothetical protein [Candidatus Cryosericum septentrionale]|jgi:hypothetical protein|nr:hypothetical protein [Candidatus Cryosericum septentrionale]